ncbi:hypothetical protein A8H33_07365 [Burkholderia vietnamiensis]|nr:hypothetical protein A8H33_07365 [Burkholderia vietnamiensis]
MPMPMPMPMAEARSPKPEARSPKPDARRTTHDARRATHECRGMPALRALRETGQTARPRTPSARPRYGCSRSLNPPS